MQPTTFISALPLFTLAAALPLNINLGAYSPALVVGDGAIELSGEEEEPRRRPATAAASSPTAAPVPAAAAAAAQKAAFEGPILNDNTASLPIPGITPKILEPRQKRGLAGFDRALQFAEVALTKGPDIQLGTGAHGAGVGIIVDNNPENDVPRGAVVVVTPSGPSAVPVPP